MCLQIKVIWVREELPVLEVYVGYGHTVDDNGGWWSW